MTQKVLLIIPFNSLAQANNAGHFCLKHYTNMMTAFGYVVHQYIFPQNAGQTSVTMNGLVATLSQTYGTVIADYDFVLIPYSSSANIAPNDQFHTIMTEGIGATTPILIAAGTKDNLDYTGLGFNNVWDVDPASYVYSWRGIEFGEYGFQGEQNTSFAHAATWESLIKPSRVTNGATLAYTRMFRYQGDTGWVYGDLSGMGVSLSTLFPLMLQEAIDAGHCPGPPKKLMMSADVDDFPEAGSINTTLADCTALYAVQIKYNIPITWGINMQLGEFAAGITDFIAARTPDRGGLIHVIAHPTGAIQTRTDVSFDTVAKTITASAGVPFKSFKAGDKFELSSTSGTNDGNYTLSAVSSDYRAMTVVEPLITESAAVAGTVVIGVDNPWNGNDAAKITQSHDNYVNNLGNWGISTGTDAAKKNDWGYRFFPANKIAGIGVNVAVDAGINVLRLGAETQSSGVTDGSLAPLAEHSSKGVSVVRAPLGPVQYGGALLVSGVNGYVKVDNNAIDLDITSNVLQNQQQVFRDGIFFSGVYKSTIYAHAENVRAATVNSSYLFSLDVLGKLVNAMPTILGWEHSSERGRGVVG